METYLVYVDAANNSNKFWSAKVEDNKVTVQWGRVGYNAQTKIHSFNSHQQANYKYHNLIAEKKAKGYQESQPQMDSSCSVADIRRALQLLNSLRSFVANHNFNSSYIQTLNDYLKIVPTPLGMQIDPYRVYQTVGDVDHQVQLLNSLLPSHAVVVGQNSEIQAVEVQTVSLKSISKNFWRNI
ncbi:WGR domain-containing protein [Nostoc sp. FACHB-145]|uniref:WGR domain-containing protein n=1 Tax=Nostoc sp. FACHB-145 TaxID=2692836 RepID=UPI0016833697|nr:WGR domain-containing protein [Nostoc sp. FACHB-145]MBD2471437.1 WGR domain-containing protein [Nostoc sp. FACHB-145]